MFFQGFFLSLVSFGTILLLSSLISSAESHYFRLLLPCLPFLGCLFLFVALWTSYLYVTVIFCSAAITFFYAASRLKKRCRCRFAARPHRPPKPPHC